MTASPDARGLAIEAARAASDEHGTDVEVLNVGAVTIIADYFVLTSAANKRLARRLIEQVEVRVAATTGDKPVRTEGLGEYDWAVLDYGDVMVHVFSVETREFYEIERLYGDVPTVDWREPDEQLGDGEAL